MTALVVGVYVCALILFFILLYVIDAVTELKAIASGIERIKQPPAEKVVRIRDEGSYDWRYPYGSSR